MIWLGACRRQIHNNIVRFGLMSRATSGAFDIEGNTVTYEVITNADGLEVIKLTIVDPDGTITEIEIPIGIGQIAGG